MSSSEFCSSQFFRFCWTSTFQLWLRGEVGLLFSDLTARTGKWLISAEILVKISFVWRTDGSTGISSQKRQKSFFFPPIFACSWGWLIEVFGKTSVRWGKLLISEGKQLLFSAFGGFGKPMSTNFPLCGVSSHLKFENTQMTVRQQLSINVTFSFFEPAGSNEA